jgi:hypothetical protein
MYDLLSPRKDIGFRYAQPRRQVARRRNQTTSQYLVKILVKKTLIRHVSYKKYLHPSASVVCHLG